jgi:hypothetical protein
VKKNFLYYEAGVWSSDFILGVTLWRILFKVSCKNWLHRQKLINGKFLCELVTELYYETDVELSIGDILFRPRRHLVTEAAFGVFLQNDKLTGSVATSWYKESIATFPTSLLTTCCRAVGLGLLTASLPLVRSTCNNVHS